MYENDIETIRGIQFCIMGPEEIVSRSVAVINLPHTFSRTDGVFNGPFDVRMGSVEHNKICPTCEQKNTFCPGHFGHIVMAKPVFFVQFFDTVRKLLGCVCYRCSKLLVDPESDKIKNIQVRKISRQKRWELMCKECKDVKKCGSATFDGCGARKPTITKEGVLKIGMEWRDEAKKDDKDKNKEKESRKIILTAEDALRIFRRITDADAELLGFFTKLNRPEYMICTVMPVPPPSVRPSVRNDNGQRSEDDLTTSILSIIKYNSQLNEKIALAKSKTSSDTYKDQIELMWQLLQYEVAAFIDNTVPGIPPLQQRNGRANRSVTERLKSKEGRIRGNLMGKRVDFSARSVISPDPNIGIDELGVPFKIAMNLTFPEIVNKYNINVMKEMVKNGPDRYPGAKFVRKNTASSYRTILLKVVDDKSKIAEDLQDGDVVERHLKNGDIVLFNRQPSLHKMSMMAHKVRVMPHHTFRLNVCVTAGYNADFDGDEMNMHVPQSLQSHEELKQLAAVKHHIISPRESKPIVAIVQDICLGVYRMTKDDVKISQKQAFNLLSTASNFSGRFPSHKIWTGRNMLSTIIPDRINVSGFKTSQFVQKPDQSETNTYNVNNVVEISAGQIKAGTFDKSVYQRQTDGLVHSIYNEYGPDRTRDFFDDTQKLICNWLVLSGFSVGISDLIIDKVTQDAFELIIKLRKTEVEKDLKDAKLGSMENKTSKSQEENFEAKVGSTLNLTTSDISVKALSQIDESSNRLINMIKSGSKGTAVNVSQMIGCLGQQNIDGKRVPYSFENRTLPHFHKYDDGPKSRGFVESSFIKGLDPQEFFFHAMAGREGLIDTAVQTSETGYIQRKLVKAMEDCKVNYDYSVRNASGSIIQFAYGDDGMDPIKIEKQTWPYASGKIEDIYVLSDQELNACVPHDSDFSEVKHAMSIHIGKLQEDKNFLLRNLLIDPGKVMYPVCFTRILNSAASVVHQNTICNLTPIHVLNSIEKLSQTIAVSSHHRGTEMFNMLVRAHLSPRIVIVKHKLRLDAFDLVIEQVKYHFYTALASPSDMVGVVAAQSIGEPSTQLTLNSVHFATEMLFRIDGRVTRCHIGEYIDTKLKAPGGHSRIELHPRNTTLMWLETTEDVEVLSCDLYGYVSWKKITALTRHPVINDDGTNTMIKVTLASGRSVVATKGDSFLMKKGTQVIPVSGASLKVGDFLPVSCVFPCNVQQKNKILESAAIESKSGRELGEYLAMTDDYRVPAELFSSSAVFLEGIVCGFFSRRGKGTSRSKGLLEDMRLLLRILGLDYRILSDETGAVYSIADIHTCQGTSFGDIDEDKIIVIEEICNDHEFAYDLTVQDTRTFNTADGLCMNDTFHSSGLASASKSVRGVPRLKELLSVSSKIKTPEMIVRFLPDKTEEVDDEVFAKKRMNHIRTIRFKDIVKTSQLYFDPDDKLTSISQDSEFISKHNEIFQTDHQSDCGTNPWLLRFVMDNDAMHEFDLGTVDLKNIIQAHGDVCDVSDDNSKEIVLRIRLMSGKQDDKKDDFLTYLKALEHTILENLVIKGCKFIENVCVFKMEGNVYDETTNQIIMKNEAIVYTVGTNLKAILSRCDVDCVRSTTNDVYEIFEVLGIEAARASLYSEIIAVLGDSKVDYRHICLLIDVMTNRGGIMPINRHGINRSDIGPLAKSSFEEMDEKLIMAGIFAECDKCNGVSANIMLGQVTPCGTGDVEVLIDEEKIAHPFVPEVIACSIEFRFSEFQKIDSNLRKKVNNKITVITNIKENI